MLFERQIILVKLSAFLTGEISTNEIYEWALFVAVSREYETLIKTDPLAENIIQLLVEINSDRVRALPFRKILEYYVACLEGTKNFSPEELGAVKGVVGAKPALPTKKLSVPAAPPKNSFLKNLLNVLIRVYIFIFLLALGVLNIAPLIKPDFLVNPGEIVPPAAAVAHTVLPHIFYAVTMMIALAFRVPRILFYGLFFIATGGMFFYWYSATDFVLKQEQSLIHLLPILPFVALPPTCVFFIMLNRWFNEAEPKVHTAQTLTVKE